MSIVNKSIHKYEILRSVEAGIVLLGGEVKSIRAGSFSFKNSYVSIRSGEAILRFFHISLSDKFFEKFDPQRDRVLLLKKKETLRLNSLLHIHKGTIIVSEVKNKTKFIKFVISAVVKKKPIRSKRFILEKMFKKNRDELYY